MASGRELPPVCHQISCSYILMHYSIPNSSKLEWVFESVCILSGEEALPHTTCVNACNGARPGGSYENARTGLKQG